MYPRAKFGYISTISITSITIWFDFILALLAEECHNQFFLQFCPSIKDKELAVYKCLILTKNTLNLEQMLCRSKQRVPQTNRSLIVSNYHLKWYNQSPWHENQTNKRFGSLSNFVLRCVPVLKRTAASAECYQRRVSADWQGECEKYNYKPGAMERANALADRTKRRDEIYCKKKMLHHIHYLLITDGLG